MIAWLAVAASVAWSAWIARAHWLACAQMQRDRSHYRERLLTMIAESERRSAEHRELLREFAEWRRRR